MFADMCYTSSYMAMFGSDASNFKVMLPSTFNYNRSIITVLPVATVDNTSSLSAARQRSGGDSSHGGGDSARYDLHVCSNTTYICSNTTYNVLFNIII